MIKQWGLATEAYGGGPYKVTLPVSAKSKIYAVLVTTRVSYHANSYYNKVYPNEFTLSTISIGVYGDLGGYWLCLTD